MKVLVADDDSVSRMRLAHALQAWGYDVVVAHDGNDAWRQIDACSEPLLLIVDWMMPGLNGLDLCRRVKADPDKRFHQLIVLTSRSAMTDTVTAIEAGADDFIAKPYHPDELKVRVRASVRILQLQMELQLKASHDDLTGLLNRRMVLDMLTREFERALREGIPLAVAMLDVDHFKNVNDSFGHLVGDEVLRRTAERMAGMLRRGDVLGRYGGEEFILVVPSCDVAAAADIAERLRAIVSSQPVDTSAGPVTVTASLGLAVSTPESPLERDEIVQAADRALYLAKAAGRNRVVLARP